MSGRNEVFYIDPSGKEWGPAHGKHFMALSRAGVIPLVISDLHWADTRASVASQDEFEFLRSLDEDVPEPRFRVSDGSGDDCEMTLQDMKAMFPDGVDYRLLLTDTSTGINVRAVVVRGLRLRDENGALLSGWRLRRVRSQHLSDAQRNYFRNRGILAMILFICGLSFLAWSRTSANGPVIAFVGIASLAFSGGLAWERWSGR